MLLRDSDSLADLLNENHNDNENYNDKSDLLKDD